MAVSPFVQNLPKAELHLHIGGALEPEMMLSIAARNGVALPFGSASTVREAYRFGNLQDFLDIHYRGVSALVKEQDFFDLTRSCLYRVAAQNVRHAEIFLQFRRPAFFGGYINPD